LATAGAAAAGAGEPAAAAVAVSVTAGAVPSVLSAELLCADRMDPASEAAAMLSLEVRRSDGSVGSSLLSSRTSLEISSTHSSRSASERAPIT